MGDIFREIDEELRQEKFEKLWRRYGKFVIGAGVAVVLVVAGVTGWNQYQSGQRRADGARFAAAMASLEEGKTGDAAALFTALAAESGTNYGTLARFHAAALEAEQGTVAGAVRAYDALASDTGLDQPLRDLAIVLSALHSVSASTIDKAKIVERIQPLATAKNPWRHTAREILGLLAEQTGDRAKAREYYQRIVDDIEAPPNMRTRATQMLAIIGS